MMSMMRIQAKTEKGATVENLDATQRQAQAIEFYDFVVESTSRIEVPRILEQLKKISELKIDQFYPALGVQI